MHGSYTRWLMESVRQAGEVARAAGYRAAKSGAPRVSPHACDEHLAHSWLAGYDAFDIPEKP